ncbi:MAG: hypothetical protein LBE08_03230 [Bifidobacteriaceae bacterium]|nr:hypothetical protein [Bifidobacteriaceae bacterium]
MALGAVWALVAPRPSARWSGDIWVAADDLGFSAVQDVWFAGLMGVAGLALGCALTAWSGRPRSAWRIVWWLGGAVGASVLAAGAGAALTGGFASPEVGATAVAPVELTSLGLLALWPFVAALVVMLALAARGLFGRTF